MFIWGFVIMDNETKTDKNLQLFRERLKNLRGKKSLQEVAHDLEISRATLGYYENGDRKPDTEILIRIAKYYNVSSDYLLGLTDVVTQDINDRLISKKTGLIEDSLQFLYKNNSIDEKIAINVLLSAYPILLKLITEYLFTSFSYACELDTSKADQENNFSIKHHMMEYDGVVPEKQIPITNLGFIDKNLNTIYVNKNTDFYLNSCLLEIQKELVELRKLIQSDLNDKDIYEVRKIFYSKSSDIDFVKLLNNIKSLLG